MACYEDEVRDKLKVDPLVARTFLNQTLEHMKPYLDASGVKQDGLGVAEALDQVAKDSGLTVQTVAKIIKSDSKLFSISKQAFNKTAESSAVKRVAETIAEQGAPKTGNVLRAYNDLRRIVLAGHSPVFPFTHARNLLFSDAAEREIFKGMVHDSWAFRGEKGDLNHQTALAEMKGNKDYKLATSTGLDAKEGLQSGDVLRTPESGTIVSEKINQFSKWVAGSKLGEFLRLDPNNSVKSFDAVKIGRFKLWKHYWDVSDIKTEAFARQLSQEINYATGSVMTPRGEAATPATKLVAAASQASGNFLLSSKLFWGKRMDAFSILRFGPEKLADVISKGGRMTPEERAIANIQLKRWGRIAATQIGILSAGVAFAKAFGLKPPNLTDPSKADFGRFRIGNFVIPLSPLMEAVREPIKVVATTIRQKSGLEGAKEAVRPVVNALTPGIQFTVEQATGKEPFSTRQIPSVRNLIQKPKPSEKPPVTAGEYIGTRFAPIAISGGIHEFYQALRNEGVSPSVATAFVKAAAGAATSGLAGTHVYEEEQHPGKAAKPVVR